MRERKASRASNQLKSASNASPSSAPRAAGRISTFRELWHYRELLGRFVWRDVTVRYKQTFLGVAWAILVPLFTAAIYVIVFGRFAKFPSGNIPYPQLVLSGLIPMQYFTSSLTGSSTSLVTNLPLVTKVYFPRVLLPLAAVFVPLVDLLLGVAVLVPFMAYYHTWPGGVEVLTAPLFVGLALVTALGIGLVLSSLNVRYRDVPYMLPLFSPCFRSSRASRMRSRRFP